MSTYRSALGRNIDMGQLAAKNEHVRAVGNQSVNARGDTIDSTGKVIVPVTKKVSESYQRTVANRAANLVRPSGTDQPVPDDVTEALAEELHPEELTFDDDDEASEIEALKAAETQKVEIKPASEAPEFVVPETTKKK